MIKLSRANPLLFNKHILRTIQFAMFDSHIIMPILYAAKTNAVSTIVILQKKALRIMNF